MLKQEDADIATRFGLNYQNVYGANSPWRAQNVEKKKRIRVSCYVSLVALIIPNPDLSFEIFLSFFQQASSWTWI